MSSWQQSNKPVLVYNTSSIDVVLAACGTRHAALVTRRGELYTWGHGKGGEQICVCCFCVVACCHIVPMFVVRAGITLPKLRAMLSCASTEAPATSYTVFICDHTT